MVSTLKNIKISVITAAFAAILAAIAVLVPTSSAAAGDSITIWPDDWKLVDNARVQEDNGMTVLRLKVTPQAPGYATSKAAHDFILAHTDQDVTVCVKSRSSVGDDGGVQVGLDALVNPLATFAYTNSNYTERCRDRHIRSQYQDIAGWDITSVGNYGVNDRLDFIRYVRITAL